MRRRDVLLLVPLSVILFGSEQNGSSCSDLREQVRSLKYGPCEDLHVAVQPGDTLRIGRNLCATKLPTKEDAEIEQADWLAEERVGAGASIDTEDSEIPWWLSVDLVDCDADAEAKIDEKFRVGLGCEQPQSLAQRALVLTIDPRAPVADFSLEFVFRPPAWATAQTFEGRIGLDMTSSDHVNLDIRVDGPGSVASPCPSSILHCSVARNRQVSLSPQPEVGARFVGWSGCASGIGELSLVASQNLSCTATFERDPDAPDYPSLTLGTNGTGDIAVTKNANPVSCPNGVCTDEPGTTFRLEARAGADSYFAGWSSPTLAACSGTERAIEVTISADATCTATFEPGVPLQIQVETDNQANGRVVASSGANIDCASDSSTGCMDRVAPNSQVTLQANPIGDASDVGVTWGGDCDGMTGNVITVSVDRQKMCTARFYVEDACTSFPNGPEIQLEVRDTQTSRVVVPNGSSYGVVLQRSYAFDARATVAPTNSGFEWTIDGVSEGFGPQLAWSSPVTGTFEGVLVVTSDCGNASLPFTLNVGF